MITKFSAPIIALFNSCARTALNIVTFMINENRKQAGILPSEEDLNRSDYFTSQQQLADYLKCSRKMVHFFKTHGLIPVTFLASGHEWYKKSEIDQLIQENAHVRSFFEQKEKIKTARLNLAPLGFFKNKQYVATQYGGFKSILICDRDDSIDLIYEYAMNALYFFHLANPEPDENSEDQIAA